MTNMNKRPLPENWRDQAVHFCLGQISSILYDMEHGKYKPSVAADKIRQELVSIDELTIKRDER